MEEEEVENVMLLRNKEVSDVDFDKGLCFTGESREKERLRSTLPLLDMFLSSAFLFVLRNTVWELGVLGFYAGRVCF